MRVKVFHQDSCMRFAEFEGIINVWLSDNPNIEIVSTNRTSNSYLILYRIIEVGNDNDEVD